MGFLTAPKLAHQFDLFTLFCCQNMKNVQKGFSHFRMIKLCLRPTTSPYCKVRTYVLQTLLWKNSLSRCIITHFTLIIVHPLHNVSALISNSCVSEAVASIWMCNTPLSSFMQRSGQNNGQLPKIRVIGLHFVFETALSCLCTHDLGALRRARSTAIAVPLV